MRMVDLPELAWTAQDRQRDPFHVHIPWAPQSALAHVVPESQFALARATEPGTAPLGGSFAIHLLPEALVADHDREFEPPGPANGHAQPLGEPPHPARSLA